MQATGGSGMVIGRLLERTDIDTFTERVLMSFAERAEFRSMRPPHAYLQAWVRWNIDLVLDWLTTGTPPDEHDLDRVRDLARACAANGTPPDTVPANYRQAARFVWGVVLDEATDEERAVLIDSAGLLFDFVDLVSRAFSDAYDEAVQALPPTADDVSARSLLSRLEWGERPLPEDVQFAQLIGLDLAGPVLPFVVLMPEGPSDALTRLARRLRAGHALAAPGGRRLSGIANVRPPWRDLDVSPDAIVAVGEATATGAIGGALDELRVLTEVAEAGGHRGPVAFGDFLPEVLLHRSPATAQRLVERVYGPLEPGRPDLVRTLDALVEHDFDRGRTAAALPVHRNTLTNRLRRVATLTGVDVDGAEGQAVVWLAWLERHRATSTPDRSNGARPGATPPGW